ncbi:MAG: hypothetical protein ACLP50_32865 [Solirubrobacteraceae bacterium]
MYELRTARRGVQRFRKPQKLAQNAETTQLSTGRRGFIDNEIPEFARETYCDTRSLSITPIATSSFVGPSPHVVNIHRVDRSAIPLVVATNETWTPSRRLQSAALAEHERVEHKLDELDRRHAELAESLGRVTAARDELREQLAMLNRLVHGSGTEIPENDPGAAGTAAPQLQVGARAAGQDLQDGYLPSGTTVLRGQAIREAAARVLAASPKASQPIHYKEWFELLRADGLIPAGKDSLATFLTQLRRSPVITRTTRQGTYMLDHDYPARARRKLEQLRRELRDAHDAPVGSEIGDVAPARVRRTELATEVDRLERQLEEAQRSLAPAEGVQPRYAGNRQQRVSALLVQKPV